MANEAPKEKKLTCAIWGDRTQCPAVQPGAKELEVCYACTKWATPNGVTTTLTHDLAMILVKHGEDAKKGTSAATLAERLVVVLNDYQPNKVAK